MLMQFTNNLLEDMSFSCMFPSSQISLFLSHVTLVVGQEGATIDCDEGVPITPFNLDDEMEEGYFDSEGNYFVKKEEIRDNWLDNIDWVTASIVQG